MPRGDNPSRTADASSCPFSAVTWLTPIGRRSLPIGERVLMSDVFGLMGRQLFRRLRCACTRYGVHFVDQLDQGDDGALRQGPESLASMIWSAASPAVSPKRCGAAA